MTLATESSRTWPNRPMRFTNPNNSAVILYPHEPLSLVPLLRKHLPKSLPVLSTILENASFALNNFFKSSPSKGKGQGKEDDEEGYDYDTVFTTFPSVDKVEDQDIWAVIVQMSEFDSIHLRFYCSAETEIEIPRPLGPPHPTVGEGEAEETIRTFVMGVTESIVRIYGREITLGAISSRWNEGMRSVVDARELVECSVFLAPSSFEVDLDAGAGGSKLDTREKDGADGDGDEEILAGLGLKLDRAREEDIAIIQSTCDVPRPLAYYASRSSQSTVIRQISSEKAVCWIILHADGSLGALYTLPQWRRKGLAEIVVRQNIKFRRRSQLQLPSTSMANNREEWKGEEEEGERRDFCYVFKGNTASEGLWIKMGWKEGWGVRWIVNRKVEEARGKVARFSHPDEKD